MLAVASSLTKADSIIKASRCRRTGTNREVAGTDPQRAGPRHGRPHRRGIRAHGRHHRGLQLLQAGMPRRRAPGAWPTPTRSPSDVSRTVPLPASFDKNTANYSALGTDEVPNGRAGSSAGSAIFSSPPGAATGVQAQTGGYAPPPPSYQWARIPPSQPERIPATARAAPGVVSIRSAPGSATGAARAVAASGIARIGSAAGGASGAATVRLSASAMRSSSPPRLLNPTDDEVLAIAALLLEAA
jgi:hypothetical protein